MQNRIESEAENVFHEWIDSMDRSINRNIPIPNVLKVYPSLLNELLHTLQSLPNDKWESKTILPNWRVRDIAAHIASGAIKKLSAIRSARPADEPEPMKYESLVAIINENNEKWLGLLRDLHPSLIIDMIDRYYRELIDEFKKLDPYAKAVHGGTCPPSLPLLSTPAK